MTFEELMNKLIKKGWKPFRKEEIEEVKMSEQYQWKWTWCFRWKGFVKRWKSTRDICSKESQLWQFLCENWMIENWKTVHDYVIKHITYSDENHCWWYWMWDAEYYMMISSLIDEPDLEEFLLDNIKIDE